LTAKDEPKRGRSTFHEMERATHGAEGGRWFGRAVGKETGTVVIDKPMRLEVWVGTDGRMVMGNVVDFALE
jgi:hypothetical protein